MSKKATDRKIETLYKNLKSGKYNNSFLKLKIDSKGCIVSFTREVIEDLKGEAEHE